MGQQRRAVTFAGEELSQMAIVLQVNQGWGAVRGKGREARVEDGHSWQRSAAGANSSQDCSDDN
jgi:hypothetical protein